MRRGYSLGLLVLATALLAACSLAPAPKAATGDQTATLAVSSSAVDFGSVSVGGTKKVSLTLTNSSDGDKAATVSKISISGAKFKLTNPPAVPAAVADGQSINLAITFSPTASGSASGTLTITSDATNSSISIPLSGAGSSTPTPAAQLSVSPATLAFGSVAVGQSVSKTAKLTATNSNVTVTTVDASGSGYDLTGISFPVTVAAGQSVSFTVTFTPQTAGSSPGSLAFVSSAADDPSAALTGTGTQVTSHTVSLSWNPSSSSSVVGYNVYRGTSSGGPYSVRLTSSPLSDTSFVDSTVQASSTYYYVATAVDSDSGESANSNQAKAVIP
jgi:hypothetical protein